MADVRFEQATRISAPGEAHLFHPESQDRVKPNE